MASKIQEIYPPQIQSFVQVTDCICSEDVIFATELDILRVLQWKLSPVTVIAWVEVYLQNGTYRYLPLPSIPRVFPHTHDSLREYVDSDPGQCGEQAL